MTPKLALNYIVEGTAGERTDLIEVVCKVHAKKGKQRKRIAGLVLSGGIIPPRSLLKNLEKAGIPVLLSKSHTYKTAEAIHDIIVKIKPEDTQKVKWAIELVENYVDVEGIVDAIS